MRRRRASSGLRRYLPHTTIFVLVLCFATLGRVLVFFLPTVRVTSRRLVSVKRRAAGPELGHVDLAQMDCKALGWRVLFVLALAGIVIQIDDPGSFGGGHVVLGIIEHVLVEIRVTCVPYVI